MDEIIQTSSFILTLKKEYKTDSIESIESTYKNSIFAMEDITILRDKLNTIIDQQEFVPTNKFKINIDQKTFESKEK